MLPASPCRGERILGGSSCSSARSLLSIHHFLKLLIHKVDGGLEKAGEQQREWLLCSFMVPLNCQ